MLADARIPVRKHIPDTAAHHYDIGLEKVDDVTEPNGDEICCFFEDLGGEIVASAPCVLDGFAGNGGNVPLNQFEKFAASIVRRGFDTATRAHGDAWARGKKLDASGLTAFAARARMVVVDAHVPAFSRGAGATKIKMAVKKNCGTDAGSDGGVENAIEAGTAPPDGFGEAGGIGVVVEFRGDAVVISDEGSEGEVAPAGKIGRHDDAAGARIDRAG